MKKKSETPLDRLRLVFSETGLPNVEIAKALSCSPAYISKLKLQDNAKPRTSFLITVSHTFSVSEEWLLEGTGPMRISINNRLKQYLSTLLTSLDPNDVFVKNMLEKYISLSKDEQTLLIKALSHLSE